MAVKQNNSENNEKSPSESSETTTNSTSTSSTANLNASGGAKLRSVAGDNMVYKELYEISVILNEIDNIQMLRQQTDELPLDGTVMVAAYKQLITLLGSVNIPVIPKDLKYFKEEIVKVGDFFAKVIEESPNMMFCFLQAVCQLIIADGQPSAAIAVILNLFNADIVSKAIEVLLSRNYNTTDKTIQKTVYLLSKWVSFCSFCPNLNVWILAIFNQLKEQQKFSLMTEISVDIIDILFRVLSLPFTRANAEPVVFHILTSIQHSPVVFHKIIHRVPRLIDQLKQESTTNEASKKLLQNLVDLMTALMAQYQGYDELYKPLVKSLAEFTPSYDFPSLLSYANQEQIGDFNLLTSSNPKVGLINLGNTCYMNSVLQALTMTKEFSREILLCGCKSPLLVKVQQLIALLLYSKRPELTPSAVLNASRPPGFAPGYQQDSSEFLGYLLETLHDQEAKFKLADKVAPNALKLHSKSAESSEYSEGASSSTMNVQSAEQNADNGSGTKNGSVTAIDKTFTGKIATTYKCLSCSWQSKNVDAFRDLQLSFPEVDNDCASNYSVQDLIDYYCSPEKLCGDNQYYCEKCKKLTDAERMISVVSPPRNLILTLKHFKYDQQCHMRAKLLHKVFHDESVSLKVCSPDTLDELASVNYNIYAGVVHSGYSMDSGHYYTYAADGTGNWYKFNDSYVMQCDFGELHNLTPPNTPYILFYQMRGLTSETPSKKVVKVELPANPTIEELPPHLREYVESDNKSFNDESRKRSRMGTRARPAPSYHRNAKDDDDDDNHSSTTSTFGDNALINVNRFIC